MKIYQFEVLSALIKRLGVAFIAFVFCRVIFFLFNQHLFDWVDVGESFKILIYGLRFDLVGMAYINCLFIVIATFPLPGIYSPFGRKLMFFVFMLTNCLAQFFNCIDIIYFRFTLRRSTSAIFQLFTLGDDIPALLPQFISNYWHIGLIWLGLTIMMGWGYKRIPSPEPPAENRLSFYLYQSLLFVFIAGLLIVSVRGGIQAKPISILTANKMVESRNVALATNTPFTMLRTLKKNYLKEKNYFTEDQLKESFSPVRNYYKSGDTFRYKNVVVIILESFNKEYMGEPFGNEGLTPFLDSLVNGGLFFIHAFANGKNSMEAIPAIVASLPSLMPNPYITSVYSGNRVSSLASILGREGYHTSFFHGGRTGTMGFDAFCRVAGFQQYHGFEDYDNKDDYDGRWGVYDEPFFQYFAKKLNETPQPFFSTFFSLSSHYPYKIPEKYEDKFPDDKPQLFKLIRYTDHALQKFFKTVKKMPWYDNTLFVVTADHTAQSFSPFYKSRVGSYAIPLLYLCPADNNLKGISKHTTQQVDIMPTILDYLNYDKPFFSFGESLFATKSSGFAVNYRNGVFQFIQDGYALQFNGNKSIALYNYLQDETLQDNLLHNKNEKNRLNEMEKACKSFVQVHINSLIQNKMTISP